MPEVDLSGSVLTFLGAMPTVRADSGELANDDISACGLCSPGCTTCNPGCTMCPGTCAACKGCGLTLKLSWE